jgi:sulfur carrier protein
MIITINGKKTELPEDEGRTIHSLLEELDVPQRLYVTVELNGEIQEREAFETTSVAPGDTVEFLHFMGGGC